MSKRTMIDAMKPERIQTPDAVTVTYVVGGDRFGPSELLALARAQSTDAQPAILRQTIRYTFFGGVWAFFQRLRGETPGPKKPIVMEVHVVADPGRANEAATLLRDLTYLANG